MVDSQDHKESRKFGNQTTDLNEKLERNWLSNNNDVVSGKMNSHIRSVSMNDFYDMGRIHAELLCTTASQSQCWILHTLKLVEDHRFNRKNFAADYHAGGESAIPITTLSKLFTVIWENAVGPLAPLFTYGCNAVILRAKFPAIYRWVADSQIRQQRNANAHRCGVMIAAGWREEDCDRQPFDPAELFHSIETLYPSLLREYSDILEVLRGQLDSIPLKSQPEEESFTDIIQNTHDYADSLARTSWDPTYWCYRLRAKAANMLVQRLENVAVWAALPGVYCQWVVDLTKAKVDRWCQEETEFVIKDKQAWEAANLITLASVLVEGDWDI